MCICTRIIKILVLQFKIKCFIMYSTSTKKSFRNKKDLNKLDEEVDVYKNMTSSFLLSK